MRLGFFLTIPLVSVRTVFLHLDVLVQTTAKALYLKRPYDYIKSSCFVYRPPNDRAPMLSSSYDSLTENNP